LRGGRSRGSGLSDPAASFEEFPLHFHKWAAIHGLAGDNHQIDAARKNVLMAAENLAKPALGAIAQDCAADGCP
jgi:hypothetical protein